tara:strand:+ start:3062 stop:4177 length:1116 start_codon:yes stop_codon:yes gene_type:complete
MQGLESLNQFKSFVSSLGGLGRYEDTYMVHAAEGETVVPMEVLDKNPVLKKRLFKTMVDMGIDPGRYIIGNELNSINPVTGQPEFFLKKIVKGIRKAIPGDLEQYLGPIVGLATGNPFLGAIAGGIGSGVGGAISGGLGGFRSPGIAGLGGGQAMNILGQQKASQVPLAELFGKEGLSKFFLGEGDKSGLIGSGGKFFSGDGLFSKSKENAALQTAYDTALENEDFSLAKDIKELMGSDKGKGIFGDLSFSDLLKIGIPATTVLSLLIKEGEPEGSDATPFSPAITNKQIFPTSDVLFPQQGMAKGGGVTDLRSGGMSLGPGTETSDDIPAMLSDGEFVMTAKAVRGAGGGDRREGAKRMYQMMDSLEGKS